MGVEEYHNRIERLRTEEDSEIEEESDDEEKDEDFRDEFN